MNLELITSTDYLISVFKIIKQEKEHRQCGVCRKCIGSGNIKQIEHLFWDTLRRPETHQLQLVVLLVQHLVLVVDVHVTT